MSFKYTEKVRQYVQAVGLQLPAEQRADIEQELTSVLLDSIEARQTDAEIDEATVDDVLREMGHPLRVAEAYKGNKPLFPAELMPLYKMTLWVVIPAIALMVIIGPVIIQPGWESAPDLFNWAEKIFSEVLKAFAYVTLAFMLAQYWWDGKPVLRNWDPKNLTDFELDNVVNRNNAITDIVIDVIALLLLNGLLVLPWFISEHVSTLSFKPELHIYLWPINIVFIADLLLKIVMLIKGMWQRHWRMVDIAINFAAIVIISRLLTERPLVVEPLPIPGDPRLSESLIIVETIVLTLLLLLCLWDAGKQVWALRRN